MATEWTFEDPVWSNRAKRQIRLTGTRTIGERFKSYILPSFILSSTATAASETNRMVAEIVAVAQADAWWDTPDIVDIFPGAVVALKTAAEALEAE